ncbi:MAG TPA: adenylate/guanylate cyclase domain-containing protein [Acidobacteriota bacterium]|nr:adenylate/guanylate cyclase domain-containing protein [Acidobacteriota bacterium]
MKDAKTRKKLFKIGSNALILVAGLLFVVFLEFTPWLAQLENATYDFVFRVRPRLTPSPQLAIAALDESSVKELGPPPWSRRVLAALLQKMKAGGARMAVFDMLFDYENPTKDDPEGDLLFADAIAKFGKVILAKDISTTSDPQFSLEQTIEPLPIFTDAGARTGFIRTIPDEDTKIRRSCWLVNEQSTLAAQAYMEITGEVISLRNNQVYIGDRRVPTESVGPYPGFVINYVGPSHTIPTRSIYQIIDGTIPPGFLKDKVVFVGADLAAENKTGGAGVDRFPTPVDEETLMPGVEIHADALNTMLTGAFIRTVSPGVTWLVLVLLAILTSIYCGVLKPLSAGFATLATIVIAAVAVYYVFAHFNLWLPSVRPTFLIVFVYSANTLMQYRMAVRERAQIQGAFKHYVSAEVLNELMKDPGKLGLGGREVEATVLFTDIAGFSKISEKITPQELTHMLNQYFELLASVIMKEGGMVNKFIGDAVMALWGVPLDNPNHAIQACRAALKIHRAMLVMDPVRCRIGINSGTMIAGNMGSRERFEYTVIGDAVNLASRLEGVNKPYQTDAMISEMTEEKVRGSFLLREVDSIRVVGKARPVRIYQLLDVVENKDAPEHERWSEMTESFIPGLEAYKVRNWDKAARIFAQHITLFPEDSVGRIYMERCRNFLTAPPASDWDGVYQMETK